ncbi:MAG: hypothetical protein ACFFAS_20490 [Promethearchaeota archaeon]
MTLSEYESWTLFIQIFGTAIQAFVLSILIWKLLSKYLSLRKRVKHFYRNIENLIFSRYQFRHHNHLYSELSNLKEAGKKIENDRLLEHQSKKSFFLNENNFFRQCVINDVEEYGKYLGFVNSIDGKKYLNKTDINIGLDGTTYHNGIPYTGSINDNLIEEITSFLEGLTDYWNDNYSRFLIRRKIKKERDFHDLDGYPE